MERGISMSPKFRVGLLGIALVVSSTVTESVQGGGNTPPSFSTLQGPSFGPARSRRCDPSNPMACSAHSFCRIPDGICNSQDVLGICTPVPQFCPDVWEPVCGCNGVTYGNRCDAYAAGVSIAHEGECAQICGGIIGIPCDDGEYCNLGIGHCCCDFQGICESIPTACPDVWMPVCGCDGVTYGNSCEAAAAGQSIDHLGPCEQVCDGFAGIPCDKGEFCLHPVGSCNVADGQGVCVPIPDACPENYDPVCGCDGVTYSNTCFAIQAGAQIDHDGECSQVCGGILGIPCDDGEYCNLGVGNCCCDFQGVCEPIPFGCPDNIDPVCGCDGVTYFNPCEAAAAGQSIDHYGPCGQVCGGITGIPCDDDEYCNLGVGNCCCDFQGVCEQIPQACPDVWDPVCGCDGVTYGNSCDAAGAGQSIDHYGPCGQICGGFAGIQCDNSNEYCNLGIGHCCCDFQGTCEPIPQGCPDVWDPVCGCDGNTYSNACDAAAAQQSIDHLGECDN